MLRRAAMLLALSLASAPTFAADLRVYGPGGPQPAIEEAAREFGRQRGVEIAVVAGPTPTWIDRARADADLIFTGSETMMADMVVDMNGQLRASDAQPLYLRPSAILVRPGNPKRIRGIADLSSPGLRILVVNGQNQKGLWEDIAGRTGDIGMVRSIRANIALQASGSGVARQAWTDDKTLDVWLTWNIWQVANPKLADLVEIEPEHRIYRDAGIALTTRGRDRTIARDFIAFLQSRDGAAIFRKWGWIANVP